MGEVQWVFMHKPSLGDRKYRFLSFHAGCSTGTSILNCNSIENIRLIEDFVYKTPHPSTPI